VSPLTFVYYIVVFVVIGNFIDQFHKFMPLKKNKTSAK
jgi:hypothetical protein